MPWLFKEKINPWVEEARQREILQASNATSASTPATIAPSSTSASTSTTPSDPYVCTLPLPDRSTGWKPTYTREDLDRAGVDTDIKRYLIKNFLEPRLNGLPKDGPEPWPDPYEKMIRQPTEEIFRSFKPGRDSGFKPVNTLDSKPAQSPRTASKQYGKPAMGAGQTKFLEILNDQSDEPFKTPTTPKSSRSRHADEPSHSSKRVKTHHNASPNSDLAEARDNEDIIISSTPPSAIGDPLAAVLHAPTTSKSSRSRHADEPSHSSKRVKTHRDASPNSDLAEVRDNDDIIISSTPPSAIGDPLAAVLHASVVDQAKKRKALKAMSQQSQGSAASSQLKRKSPPTSAFQATDALGNPHRKKRRTSNIVRPRMEGDGYGSHQSPTPSPERELFPQTGARADQAISLSDDEAPSAPKPHSHKLAKKPEQVPVQDDGSEDELHVQDPVTITSKYFAKKTNGSARINHSTEPRRGVVKATFAKPLERHKKSSSSATMPTIEQNLLEKRIQNGASQTDPKPKRTLRLINQLDPKATDLIEGRSTRAVQNGLRPRNSAPSESLSRPRRATRSNQPAAGAYGEDDEIKNPIESVPYSEDPGLGKPWRKSLTFYGPGRTRALVDFEDLIRLDDGQFLNDQLIDFYMIYLFEQAKVPKNKVYFFNTHFYTALTRPVPGQRGRINYAAVARWTATEDIFNYDYIVVPVCEANHWYLAIICNVSNIPRKPAINELDESSPAPKVSSETPIEPSAETPVDTMTNPNVSKKSTAQVDITIPSSEQEEEEDEDEDEEEEEVSLFDEEQRNRRNPSAEIAAMFDEINGNIKTDSGSSRQSPTTAQTARMDKLTIDESIPKGILGEVTSSPPASRKKGKSKSNPLKTYDLEEPIVLVFDSLGMTHTKAVKALKDYLLEEGRAKRGMDAVLAQNAFYPREQHIPQQSNFYDCGVYLLGYLQKFFEDPQTFITRILLREMKAKTEWPKMAAPKIRNSMRDILQGLARQQDKKRKAKHKAKKAEKSVEMDAGETEPTQKLSGPSKPRSQSPEMTATKAEVRSPKRRLAPSLRSPDTTRLTNTHRGSSEDPIQIDDSQDTVEAAQGV